MQLATRSRDVWAKIEATSHARREQRLAAREAQEREWAEQLRDMIRREEHGKAWMRRSRRAREVRRLLILHRALKVSKPRVQAKRSAAQLIAEIEVSHGIPQGMICGVTRRRPIVRARQEAAYRIRVELGYSLTRIGKLMGGKDHTTALHAIRAHAKRNNLPLPRGMRP